MWFQIPYREARSGYWGDQTSTLNWCEEDYNITYYCAEFINTITNVIFIYLGATGIRNVVRYNAPPILILSFLSYMVVGFGSIAFHTTLKYSMQLADELPMIYSTCIMSYITFSYRKSAFTSLLIAAGLIALAAAITIIYTTSKDPVFHQVAYGVLLIGTVFRGFYVMEHDVRPALKKRSPARADYIMKQMWQFCFTGIGLFLLGFIIWNIDNIFCVHLRSWRDVLLLPWAVVLEGHAWWHLLTGLGAYYLILWRVWLQRCLDGQEDQFYLRWPTVFTSIPQVVPIPAANGESRKRR